MDTIKRKEKANKKTSEKKMDWMNREVKNEKVLAFVAVEGVVSKHLTKGLLESNHQRKNEDPVSVG